MNTANLDRYLTATESTDSSESMQMRAQSSTLVICSCTKGKALAYGKAEEMYVGQIFSAINTYRKSHGYDLVFLSAKLGLLAPDMMIEKYDLRLKTQSDAKRLQNMILAEQYEFIQLIANYQRIEIIMGSVYESVIVPILLELNTHAEIFVLEKENGIFDYKKNLKRLSDGDFTVLKKMEAK